MTVQSVSAALTVLNPPPAPTNLTATLQAGPQVSLNWQDNANNETGFVVERATGGGAFAQIATVGANVTTYLDTTVQLGTTYTYRVAAVNNVGASVYSNTVQVTVQSAVAAPTNLTATIQTTPSLQVQLIWTDNATNETGFVIERAVNGGAFTTLTTVGPRVGTGNVNYSDTAVTGGNTYAYRVAAVNGPSMSAYSNTATAALIAPVAPSNVNVIRVHVTNNADRVVVTWTDNSNNETGFTIQRSTSPAFPTGPTTVTATVGANTTTYTSTNFPRTIPNIYVRVRATNSFGNSVWVNATPFPVVSPP